MMKLSLRTLSIAAALHGVAGCALPAGPSSDQASSVSSVGAEVTAQLDVARASAYVDASGAFAVALLEWNGPVYGERGGQARISSGAIDSSGLGVEGEPVSLDSFATLSDTAVLVLVTPAAGRRLRSDARGVDVRFRPDRIFSASGAPFTTRDVTAATTSTGSVSLARGRLATSIAAAASEATDADAARSLGRLSLPGYDRLTRGARLGVAADVRGTLPGFQQSADVAALAEVARRAVFSLALNEAARPSDMLPQLAAYGPEGFAGLSRTGVDEAAEATLDLRDAGGIGQIEIWQASLVANEATRFAATNDAIYDRRGSGAVHDLFAGALDRASCTPVEGNRVAEQLYRGGDATYGIYSSVIVLRERLSSAISSTCVTTGP